MCARFAVALLRCRERPHRRRRRSLCGRGSCSSAPLRRTLYPAALRCGTDGNEGTRAQEGESVCVRQLDTSDRHTRKRKSLSLWLSSTRKAGCIMCVCVCVCVCVDMCVCYFCPWNQKDQFPHAPLLFSSSPFPSPFPLFAPRQDGVGAGRGRHWRWRDHPCDALSAHASSRCGQSERERKTQPMRVCVCVCVCVCACPLC